MKIITMKILVVIPCYNKHIPKLLELLQSIEEQTRKPDMVSISCSSMDEQLPKLNYTFPVIVKTHISKKKPSENRNIAVRHAQEYNPDIISFFDSDDIMHPQRLELLEMAFMEPCDIALHSYYHFEETLQDFPQIINPIIQRNVLLRCISGCIKLHYNARIAHGHVTVRKEIWDIIQFPEEDTADFREDCIFCYNVCSLPNIKTTYLDYPLLKYYQSRSYSRD